ncbi:MAG: SDR family NAD(P)-dependent oxidoreductase [Oscillospiraceae bacterium]|jgi:dTDP-glucose 4,6-dehydratase|nr:SDR family NAD(P)-dependent oxidoreductase [Oscillospiraceae bacterium]
MEKVLVTGAGGFIGSHLVEELVESGYKVRAFVRYNSRGSLGWLDGECTHIKSDLEVLKGDIRDQNAVLDAVKGVDWVFHLAALIGIPYSYFSQDSYVDTNIKGTLNVLQAAKRLGTNRVLVTSTSEVYGTASYVPIDENHPLKGQSPYSATKIGADKIAQSFYTSFGLPVTTVRPFNTYGPRQSMRAVIPTIIVQALSSDEIRLGLLTPTRDLNFVRDTTRAFLEIAKSKQTIGEEINIASGREISVGDLARAIVDQINPNAKIILEEKRMRPPKSEVDRLLGCNEKILALTNWKPRFSLEEGLVSTIEWFKKNKSFYADCDYKL